MGSNYCGVFFLLGVVFCGLVCVGFCFCSVLLLWGLIIVGVNYDGVLFLWGLIIVVLNCCGVWFLCGLNYAGLNLCGVEFLWVSFLLVECMLGLISVGFCSGGVCFLHGFVILLLNLYWGCVFFVGFTFCGVLFLFAEFWWGLIFCGVEFLWF